MKVSIVNFSDVHFVGEKNSVLEKKDSLIKAIASRINNSEKKLFLMNGDSAFSGQKKEYEIAFDFFSDIISKFDKADFLCVPGNHDCNFKEMDETVRELLLDTIKNDDSKINKLIDSVILQKEYDEYFSIFVEDWKFTKLVKSNPILKTVDFLINENQKIRFNLINTSWDSTLHERPGTMYMPIAMIEEIEYDNDAILNFSVIHHPTHWLEPNNKREFDNSLEKVSDLILTGHEHQDTKISKISKFGETIILEGSVLQENFDSKISGFNIITIEMEDSTVSNINLEQFNWCSQQKMYIVKNSENIDIDIIRKKVNNASNGDNNHFFLKKDTSNYINDLGANIIHPRHPELRLLDIFVYPDFKNLLENKNSNQDIQSDDLIDEIINSEGVWFIEGDKESGKTTLLKKLYGDFYEKKIVPLILDGESISDEKFLLKAEKNIKKEFNFQYEGNMYEHFLQLNTSNKILLIDNWGFVKLNKNGKKELIRKYLQIFSKIIIVAESMPNNTSDILGLNDELRNSIKFIEIKKFGFKKREEIVSKWIRLGNEFTKEDKDIIFDIDRYTKQIDEVIGKSYVPQVPIYILIILQSLDSGRDLSDFNSQSNGYYYELLIKQLINEIGIDNNEMALLHNYLNYFAYKAFLSNEKSLSSSEWHTLHENYLETYELDPKVMSFDTYKKRLIKSRILKEFLGDRYTFTYNYAMYFFVAQYLSNNISEDLIKNIVIDLIENINIGINANVLIFLTHLSKDDFILNTVVKVANKILLNNTELKMEEDILELNQLLTELPTLVFENTSVLENRKKYNKVRDLSNSEEKHFTETENINKKKENEVSSEEENGKDITSLTEKNNILIEIDKAQKISEVIGQILKNYSGSIIKDTKRNLLEAAYNVNLRSGSELVNTIRTEKDELVNFISERIIEDGVIETNDRRKVESAAKKIVFKFVEMICFSIIHKSVKDTGSSSLRITYDNLMKNDLSMIKKLIVSGSYLETMYIDPSTSYVHNVFEKTEKNLMARSILKQMAAKYMYLFDLTPQERQKIASKFEITYNPVVKARLDYNK